MGKMPSCSDSYESNVEELKRKLGWGVLARLERNGKESPSIFLWNLSTFWSHMFSLTCSC